MTDKLFYSDRNFIHRLFLLMLEVNSCLTEHEKDALEDREIKDADTDIQDAIKHIRQHNLKAKSQLNKYWRTMAENLLNQIQGRYDSVDAFVENVSNEPEMQKVVALYSNLESISEDDKKKIILDKKLLELMEKLKQKGNESH